MQIIKQSETNRWCRRGDRWTKSLRMQEGVGPSSSEEGLPCIGAGKLPAHFQEGRWRAGIDMGGPLGLVIRSFVLIWEAQLERPKKFLCSLWGMGDLPSGEKSQDCQGVWSAPKFKVKPASAGLWCFCSIHDGECWGSSRLGFLKCAQRSPKLETGEQRPFFLCMGVQCEDGPNGKPKSGDRVRIREPGGKALQQRCTEGVSCRPEVEVNWGLLSLSFQPFAVPCANGIRAVATEWCGLLCFVVGVSGWLASIYIDMHVKYYNFWKWILYR